MIQCAIPDCILAVAIPIVSNPEAQYLLTVTPGTSSIFNPIKEINRPIFNPCSASGMAFPTITSSIRVLSKWGNSFIMN